MVQKTARRHRRTAVAHTGGAVNVLFVTMAHALDVAAAIATVALLSACRDKPPPVTPNQPPTVSIVTPARVSSVLEGESVSLQGSATDPEDGMLSASALNWMSDVSGSLGSGNPLTVQDLDATTHWIVLEAVDSDGSRARDSVTLLVQAVSKPDRPVGEEDVAAGFILGRILIGYSSNTVDDALIATINREYGLTSQRRLSELDIFVGFIETDPDSMPTLVAALNDDARIAAASVEPLIRESAVPSDYAPDEQRHLYQTGIDLLWRRMEGSGKALGGTKTIAIIDSGIDTDHPEFPEWKIVDPVYLPDNPFKREEGLSAVEDTRGHGTHVASIAAGSGAEGNGILGVAPDASIIPIKVGDGAVGIIRGIVYAANHDADVINISKGIGHVDNVVLQTYLETSLAAFMVPTIEYATIRGARVVIASGNCGRDYSDIDPIAQATEGIIVVGGSNVLGDDVFDNIPDLECLSRTLMSQGGPGLDVVAPGEDIRAAGLAGSTAIWDGTSMAAPLVSGLIALHLEAGVPPADIESVLMDNTIDLGEDGRDDRTGFGRVIAGIGLDNIEPGAVEAGSANTLTLSGRNFDRNASVWVGTSEITPTSIHPNQLTFNFTAPSEAIELPVFVRHPRGSLVSDTVFVKVSSGVPLAPRQFAGFYSMQLRGMSFEPNGQHVEIYIYDNTYDQAAFGRITITSATDGTTVHDHTYGDYGVYKAPGTYADSLVLPYNVPLNIAMTGQEFSQMNIILGSTTVASGGTFESVYPMYDTTLTISH